MAMSRQPWRIAAAALLRKRTLRLGELNGTLPTSLSPLSSAFASTTAHPMNMYILASGEEEGLAPGERLEVYGSTVCLVHAVAYDKQRNNNNNNNRGQRARRRNTTPVNNNSCSIGQDASSDIAGLQAITAQLDKVHALYQNGLQTMAAATRQPQSEEGGEHAADKSASTGNTSQSTKRESESSRVRLVHHESRQVSGLQGDNAEVVLAEWTMQGDTEENTNKETKQNIAAADTRKNAESEAEDATTLLTENGIYFPSVDSAGLRVMRAARLAFLARVQATAMTFAGLDSAASHASQGMNYMNSSNTIGMSSSAEALSSTITDSAGLLDIRHTMSPTQRHSSSNSSVRHHEEPHRPLAILDVSEIDASCAETALQAAAEAGLQAETAYHVSYVPLTHFAARRVGPAMLASNALRLVVRRPGYAHARPLELLHSYYFDTAAYTAYIDLRTRHDIYSKDFGPDGVADSNEDDWPTHDGISSTRITTAEAARAEDVKRLARAMMTLRRGAAMLITLLPTPVSVAALRREVQAQMPACRSVDVEIESALGRDAKRLVAAAISRTGRWASITDEILPAVDAQQGSAVSLMVIIE